MKTEDTQTVMNGMIKLAVDEALDRVSRAYVETGQPAVTDRERRLAHLASIPASSATINALRILEL